MAGRRVGAHGLGRPRQRDGRRVGRRSGRRDERLRRQAQHDEPVHRRARDRDRPPERRDRGAGGRRRHRRARPRPSASSGCPRSTVVDHVEAATTAAPIEEARIIVAGGRGVGGPDGFGVVEELAEALGGAVGATRAAVDAGWIPYAQQIGQTGKIVKPALYLALGISGAIQHKVGMQTAETIVAVNRDPDAPIAEFADLVVIGDLFEVAPAILAALRDRARLSDRTGRHVELQPLLVLPLLAFFVLGALFLHRPATGRQVPRRRPATSSGSGARSAISARRIETSLAEICARIDSLRRGQLDAEALVDDLTASVDARRAVRRRGEAAPSAGRRRSRSATGSSPSSSGPGGRSRWSSTAARSRPPRGRAAGRSRRRRRSSAAT